MWPELRRLTRSRTTIYFLTFCGLLSLYDIIHLRWAFLSSLDVSSPPLFHHQRIFVASNHWNSEAILKSHWNAAVVELVEAIGVANVYISIYESGSWDGSKNALRELDLALDTLGTSRTVVLDETTHQDEIERPPAASGWIDTPRGRKELRRIPYLSKLRNLSLKPLYELERAGERFDKILFLNDVVFQIDDFIKLLATNEGNYAAACALDFAQPPDFYDTFALRDSNGDEAVMQKWPYFRSRASRQAMLNNQAVPVRSCWNGMVLMDAAPFYHSTAPLEFRSIPDSLAEKHVEASECCLIHVDNPLTQHKGVWLNPHVRVGYSGSAYETVHQRTVWPLLTEFIAGIWKNRIWRWKTTTWLTRGTILKRFHAWQLGALNPHESGIHCLKDESQVLVPNGWAHV